MTITMISPVATSGVVQGRSGVNYVPDSFGQITNVNPADIFGLFEAGWQIASKQTRTLSVSSPLPADLLSIKAAATPANGAITIAAQPVQARKMQVRIVLGTPGTTNITAGTLTLVGIDQDGQALSEVVDLTQFAAVSGTYTTKWAYAGLTSGTVANYAASGSGTGNTLGIGLANAFGLPSEIPQGSFAMVKSTKITKVLGTSNTAVDDVASTGTLDTVARTFVPTTAPAANGLVDFEFTYSFNGS